MSDEKGKVNTSELRKRGAESKKKSDTETSDIEDETPEPKPVLLIDEKPVSRYGLLS